MTHLGKYELHEEIGRGGFGAVYRATDTILGRDVALKVLHPQLTVDEGFLEKFRNEAKIVAGLDNPHIVTVYDLGECEGRVFIAMKYMAGGSLKQKLENDGAFSFDQTLAVMRQICAGLHAAHKKLLIHRDIKPANILFDSEGNAVISDFGLAKAVELSTVSVTSGTAGVGTPAYKAPELWEGKPPASPATDIYSLGCVLFEMVSGNVLFNGETTGEIITQHLIKGPQIPQDFSEDLPDGFLNILLKAFVKEQKNRTQSAAEFFDALALLSSNINVEKAQKSGITKRSDIEKKSHAEKTLKQPEPRTDHRKNQEFTVSAVKEKSNPGIERSEERDHAHTQTMPSGKKKGGNGLSIIPIILSASALIIVLFGFFILRNSFAGSRDDYTQSSEFVFVEITSTPENNAKPTSSVINNLDSNSANEFTNVSNCTNEAEFISETIADGSTFDKAAKFIKTWTIENTGTCTWTDSYYLVFVEGDQMSGPDSQKIITNVIPGDQITVSLSLKAPAASGFFPSEWQLCSEKGDCFFDLFLKIAIPEKLGVSTIR